MLSNVMTSLLPISVKVKVGKRSIEWVKKGSIFYELVTPADFRYFYFKAAKKVVSAYKRFNFVKVKVWWYELHLSRQRLFLAVPI